MEPQPAPTTLDEVRLAILRQHTQLAQLIDELEAHATAVLAGGNEERPAAVRQALQLLETRFLRHLEYEETHLTRWLPAAAASAAPPLLGDHEDQRLCVKGLAHDRQVFSDPRTLAHEALTLVHRLRKDMAEEEAKLRALR